MKKRKQWLAALLALLLLVCLFPAAALAAEDEQETAPDAGAETEEAALEDTETANETETLTVDADGVIYAGEGAVVYNNGGTVYNNGACVFNNAGLVYNNAGTVYNNAGTVYANAGIVYNNDGIVFDNGAELFDHSPGEAQEEEPERDDLLRISAGEGAAALVTIDGLPAEGGVWFVEPDAAHVLAPREGCLLLEAESDAGSLTAREDGSYLLSVAAEPVTLSLRLRAEAPSFSLEAGTYPGPQSLTLSAAEGAEIYYTTDGSAPDESENTLLYEAPIEIAEGMTVTAAAVLNGAEVSEIVSAAYAVPVLTAPEFEPVASGTRPDAAPILVENPGDTPAVILHVTLSGADAGRFLLSNPYGGTIPAGASDNTSWLVRPAPDLADGIYHATVVVTLDSGEKAELEITHQVGEVSPSAPLVDFSDHDETEASTGAEVDA